MLGREKTVVRGNRDESDLVQGTGIALSKTRSMAEGPPGLSLPPVACRGNQPLLVSGKGTICLESRRCRSSEETERAFGCMVRESFTEELRFELGLKRRLSRGEGQQVLQKSQVSRACAGDDGIILTGECVCMKVVVVKYE